ncbi:MAG: hypothetical protein ACFFCS_24120 [Candidatus Hodarchaeota archaeon]
MFHARQSEESILKTIAKIFAILVTLVICSEFVFPAGLGYNGENYELKWLLELYFEDYLEWMFDGDINLAIGFYLIELIPRILPAVFLLIGLILILVNKKKDTPALEILSSRRVITPLYLAFCLFLYSFIRYFAWNMYMLIDIIDYGISDSRDVVFYVIALLFQMDTPVMLVLLLYSILLVGKTSRFTT